MWLALVAFAAGQEKARRSKLSYSEVLWWAVWSQECWEFFYSFGNFDHCALLYLPKTVPLSLPGARLFLLFRLDFTKTGAAPHQSDLGLSEGKGYASPIRLEAPPKLKVIPPNSFRIPNPRVPISFNTPQHQGQGLLSPLLQWLGRPIWPQKSVNHTEPSEFLGRRLGTLAHPLSWNQCPNLTRVD